MRQIELNENNVVICVIKSLKPLRGYVKNEDSSVVIGSTLNEDGSFDAPLVEFDLGVEKEKAVKIIENKTEMLIDYLKRQYSQSKELGSIASIKSERNHYYANKDKYDALSDKDKEEYVKALYPANYAYMRVKGRTLEEQIPRVDYKAELTYLASAKVEDLKSRISACENENDFVEVKKEVDYINSLETVKDFMMAMGNVSV